MLKFGKKQVIASKMEQIALLIRVV